MCNFDFFFFAVIQNFSLSSQLALGLVTCVLLGLFSDVASKPVEKVFGFFLTMCTHNFFSVSLTKYQRKFYTVLQSASECETTAKKKKSLSTVC